MKFQLEPQIASLLKELEKSRQKFWNIDRQTGQFLNLLIRTQNYKTVLEIGTSTGYSGIWLAEALTHTGGHLYTIESHKKLRYGLGQENFQRSGLTNITHILGHAPEDIPKEPASFDLAFFDATKREHIKFFSALKRRINPDGLIITDNISSHREELSDYLEAIQNDDHFSSVELNLGTGLLLSLKH